MARKRRKRKVSGKKGIPHTTSWLMVGIAAIALGLLLLVGMLQDGSISTLLYSLLGLGLLGIVLGLLAILRRHSDNLSEKTGLLSLTYEIAQQLTDTADPATATFRAIHTLQQHMDVERVALFVTDQANLYAELLVEAQESEYAGAWAGRLPLDRLPVLHKAIQTRSPTLWRKITSLRLPPDSAHLLTANLSVLYIQPLLSNSAPVGFLALASARPRRLVQIQRQGAINAIAQLLALYIHTVSLQPGALRAQDQIELLYEVTTHLNTDLSLEKVMSKVLTQSRAKVGATRGSLFLLDEQNRVTHRILARENLAPEISQLVIQEIMVQGLPIWIMQNKRGTLIQDTLQDDRWLVLSDHAGQVRSAVAVPIMRHGQVQGMLFLTHPEVNRFRQEHLELLTSIASQAAMAIQNARLYERVQAERRTLSAVLDSSANAVVVIDPENQVLLANPAALNVLGIENRPAPLAELVFHPDLRVFLEQALSKNETICEEIRLADGRTFSVSVAPVHDHEGRTIGRVALMHDITHLIELDEMKSRFVSTVSHDLKAPLTAIRGFIDLIDIVGPLNDEQGQFVVRIRRVTEEMSDLISDLLDLGKIEAGIGFEPQLVNLGDILISGKYDLARPAQNKGILVDVEFPPDLPQVYGDPYRLQRVTSNLVGNAIKYTPRGGHVWVRATREGDKVIVSVRDTGIGIPPTDLPHIFEKFYRVSDTRVVDQEGSGLGLAIVKSIVEEHGGRVWAESTPGKGSHFQFSIPLSTQR